MKRHETAHAVTFEIAEAKVGTAATFQPRIRLDAIVFVNIGPPRRSPLDALEVLANAFDAAARSGRDRRKRAPAPKMTLPSQPGVVDDLSGEAA